MSTIQVDELVGKARSIAQSKLEMQRAGIVGLQLLPSVSGAYLWNAGTERVVARRGAAAYYVALGMDPPARFVHSDSAVTAHCEELKL